MKILKKSLFLFLFISIIVTSFDFVKSGNDSIAGFLLETSKKTFKVDESIDLTVLAVDSEGYLVKNYSGEIFIELEGSSDLDYGEDYNMSNDGFYSFVSDDNGYKIFEEFLTVNKPGKYSITVSDMVDDTILGIYDIRVMGNDNNNNNYEDSSSDFDQEDVIHWMYDKGLSDYANKETFNPEKNIRRDEAAKFITKFAYTILGAQGQEDSKCYMFQDIDKKNKLRQYVIQSCELGYMKGTNNKFNPSGILTQEQAIAIIIRMHQGLLEEPKSDRSKNYYSSAEELGLLDGLKKSDKKNPINRGDFASLLYNLSTYGQMREDSETIYEESEGIVTEFGDALVDGLAKLFEYFMEMFGFNINSHTGMTEDFINQASLCQSGASITSQINFDMLGMNFIMDSYRRINGRNSGKCEIYERIEDADVNISSGQIQSALASGYSLDEINSEISEMKSNIKDTIGDDGTCLYDTGILVTNLQNELSGTFIPSSLMDNSTINCTGSLYQD